MGMIHAMYELGISSDFSADSSTAKTVETCAAESRLSIEKSC
jgi:hypothetical protein